MRMHARLERLERVEPQQPEWDRCPTCGEPRAWALPIEWAGAPRCLDCGGVILLAGSPAQRPPPALSPMIDASGCDRCGLREVTAQYFGRAAHLCGACWIVEQS